MPEEGGPDEQMDTGEGTTPTKAEEKLLDNSETEEESRARTNRREARERARLEQQELTSSTEEEEDDNSRHTRKKIRPLKKSLENDVIVVKNLNPANPSGAGSMLNLSTNPSGVASLPSNPSGEGSSKENDHKNDTYNAIRVGREKFWVNSSLRKGGSGRKEENRLGTLFSDERRGVAHHRSVFETKQNISFSFDPKTLVCASCLGRGGHPVGGGGGGGEAGFRPGGPEFPKRASMQ
jgi:hypothetical protein